MPRKTDQNQADIRSLLKRIQAAGIPLRNIEEGRPFNLMTSALKRSIPPHRLVAIEPPTFGFGAVQAFFDFFSPVLGLFDRWVLPILASGIIDFYWRETMGSRRLPASSHDVFDLLGMLPIRIPHQDLRDRLGNQVQLIRAASDDEQLVSELTTDLESLVFSIYGLECSEIDLVEDDPY